MLVCIYESSLFVQSNNIKNRQFSQSKCAQPGVFTTPLGLKATQDVSYHALIMI